MARVQLNKICKSYGATQVVHELDLDINHNEFVALVGPSGCGKSTTLRMIAGLESVTSGTVKIGDRTVNDLRPRDRNISMVFQSYALFPHMNVRDNMSFGLRIAKHDSSVINERVAEAAEILGLTSKLDRKPAHLSGGERQRVAMGRAMVRRPDVFLFDEPLSNLDAKLRTVMRHEIKRLHQQVDATMIYVTHDQVEAMTLADRVIIMRDGYIEQLGTPEEVYKYPRNTFVAGFIGSPPMNFIPAELQSGAKSILLQNGQSIALPEGKFEKPTTKTDVSLGIRPEDIVPEGYGPRPEVAHHLEPEIIFSEPLGGETHLAMDIGGKECIAKMLNPRSVRRGEIIPTNINMQNIHLFDATSGKSLRKSVQ